MKKENKIIMFICLTILVNCIIVILFSREIFLRNEVAIDKQKKITENADMKNEEKKLQLVEQSKNLDKEEEEKSEDASDGEVAKEEITSGSDDNNIEDKQLGESKDENQESEDSKKDESASEQKDSDQNDNNSSTNEELSVTDKEKELSNKIIEQKKINQDVIGYVQIEGTKVDYPVLQGTDNEYYLNNDINKKFSEKGSISVDVTDKNASTEFADNTVLYGNNVSDGTMFGILEDYKIKDYAKEHPYIYYQNSNMSGKWKVFSVYYIDGDREEIMTSFQDESKFKEYLETAQKRSLYPIDTEIDNANHILTLCTNSFEYSNGKTIVQAVLVEE